MKVNETDVRSGEKVVSAEGFGKKIKDLPTALKHLLLNPTYMCFMLGGSIDNFLINGFITFFPKYMEHEFAMTASSASFYAGKLVVCDLFFCVCLSFIWHFLDFNLFLRYDCSPWCLCWFSWLCDRYHMFEDVMFTAIAPYSISHAHFPIWILRI